MTQRTISDQEQTVWCMHVYLLVGTKSSLNSSHPCTDANLLDEKVKPLGFQPTFQIEGLSWINQPRVVHKYYSSPSVTPKFSQETPDSCLSLWGYYPLDLESPRWIGRNHRLNCWSNLNCLMVSKLVYLLSTSSAHNLGVKTMSEVFGQEFTPEQSFHWVRCTLWVRCSLLDLGLIRQNSRFCPLTDLKLA